MYGKSPFLMFFNLFGYLGPFGPLSMFFKRINHTNLTRRIDLSHPEPPSSPIQPKWAFSFFHFLGFQPEDVRFLGFESVFWASGERRGSIFWASGAAIASGVFFCLPETKCSAKLGNCNPKLPPKLFVRPKVIDFQYKN